MTVVAYEPETGLLRWRAKARTSAFDQRSHRHAGTVAGELRGRYLVISFDYARVFVHRLVWRIAHGSWPRVIDHINGDRTDNRLSNLRSVTHALNSRNQTHLAARSSSGTLGVYAAKQPGRWTARIGREQAYLGTFDSVEAAAAARRAAEAAREYHPNHGRGGTR